MRSLVEIQAMIDKLNRFNAVIDTQLHSQVAIPDEEMDELCAAFNWNAQSLCALQWVMGAETMA